MKKTIVIVVAALAGLIILSGSALIICGHPKEGMELMQNGMATLVMIAVVILFCYVSQEL